LQTTTINDREGGRRMIDWYKEFRKEKALRDLLWKGLLAMPHNCNKDHVHALMDEFIQKLDELNAEEDGEE
jgi:hypothetical protein